MDRKPRRQNDIPQRKPGGLPQKTTRMRLFGVAFFMIVVGFGAVIYNLFQIQIVDGEFYQQKAIAQQLRTTSITANRGAIYDRNGKTLAASATVWTVLFSPADITDEEAEILADGMSEILGVDREFVVEKAKNKKNYYQIVKKKVEKDVAEQVLQFASEHKIKGVSLQEDSKRYYPYGDMGSHLIGFTNDENVGAYGIESQMNQELTGTNGKQVSAKNAQGTDLNFRYEDIYAAEDGYSLVLTVDETIQHILDKHLETAVAEHGVDNRATGIIMNVKTGEILAMSTQPSFDPNEPYTITDPDVQRALDALAGGTTEEQKEAYSKALNNAWFSQWNNKAITEPYEPGSVFKIVTLAAGLESGACNPGSYYYCDGSHTVGGVTKHCWKLVGHGSQNLAEAVQNSCNPAFMMMSQSMGAETFYHYFEAFGLTEGTGIDLPGEAGNAGLFHPLEVLANPNDYENSLTSESFGQTFKVTPIQMITAVSAAVNGGYLYEPYVVSQVLDPQGNVVVTNEPTMKRQVISEETSALVASMLEGVVTDGSGKNAYVPGYRVGGKTGTSEKIDLLNQSGSKKHILSFVGVAPMDDPQIACLILLDEPHLTNAYGSTIAAPVVGAVLSEVLPYMGVEKVYTAAELENAEVTLDSYVGLEPHAAQSEITAKGLSVKIMGSGGKVLSQVPAAGTDVPRSGTVILYTDYESQQNDTVTVPDVVGLTGLVANKTILNAGLNIKVAGAEFNNETVVAAKQSIEPGTQVPRGTLITIDFADTDYSELDLGMVNSEQ